MLNLGDVPASSVLPILFDTFAVAGESITASNFAVTDVEIYAGTSMTQRASDNGVVLMDTDGIDLDGDTGAQGFSIDLGDNSDAGFYAVGTRYRVRVSTITVDSKTVGFTAAVFRIVAAESIAGKPKVDVDAFGGTAGTFSSGRPEVNTTHAAGTAWNSGAIGAGTIATDAIGSDEIAASAVTKIQNGLALAATALSTSQWTNARAGYLDNINNANLASVPAFPSNFAALGINASGHISRVTLTDTTTTNTDMITQANIRTAIGMASANMDTQLSGIAFSSTNGAFYSAQIGSGGAGLNSIPWNAAWDAEVQSECADAIAADKTGYKLASDGLDSVATTAPTGVASNFREMIVQTWRRFFKKTVYDIDDNNIKTYADNGTTVITTQTTAVSATEETQGAAS